MNPFCEKSCPIDKALENWQQLYPRPYNKREVDPYTKTRVILANGAEFEANWFSHQFSRHIDDNDLRRELALTRFIEKQQQIKISLLKPSNESILEHTISYEQLAVDLTAELARHEKDCYVKRRWISRFWRISIISTAMRTSWRRNRGYMRKSWWADIRKSCRADRRFLTIAIPSITSGVPSIPERRT